jgi:hypothetical protein
MISKVIEADAIASALGDLDYSPPQRMAGTASETGLMRPVRWAAFSTGRSNSWQRRR